MLLQLLFKSKKKKSERGIFGYYSLIDWWDIHFTESEKERFKQAYTANLMPVPFDKLFYGAEKPLMETENKKKSAVSFLNFLIDKLSPIKGSEDICQKLIDKCSQLIYAKNDELDVYTYYLSQVSLYTKLIQNDTTYDSIHKKNTISRVEIL